MAKTGHWPSQAPYPKLHFSRLFEETALPVWGRAFCGMPLPSASG